MWLVGEPAWSVGLGGARPWKWLEVLKVSGGGKEDPWAQGIIKLTCNELAFCNHERWPKSLASTGPKGGSWRVEAGPTVFVPQFLLMDTIILEAVPSMGHFLFNHFRLCSWEQETQVLERNSPTVLGTNPVSSSWLSRGAALDLQRIECSFPTDSLPHPSPALHHRGGNWESEKQKFPRPL